MKVHTSPEVGFVNYYPTSISGTSSFQERIFSTSSSEIMPSSRSISTSSVTGRQVPVRPDQEELLTRIARTITQNRDRRYRSERITKATIIRAYTDALSTLPLDVDNITDEKVLLQRVLDSLEN